MSQEFRDLKCTLPADEFGAIQWAAKRAGKNHTAQPLADFMRETLLARVRETVRGEVQRGKSIPPDIAAIVDTKRSDYTG